MPIQSYLKLSVQCVLQIPMELFLETKFLTFWNCCWGTKSSHACASCASWEWVLLQHFRNHFQHKKYLSTGACCPEGSSSPILYSTQSSSDYLNYIYPCVAGTYGSSRSLSSVQQYTLCPIGSYCPSSSSSPTHCSPETYEPSTGSGYGCKDCEADMHVHILEWVVWQFHVQLVVIATISPTSNPCSAGTFTDSTDLVNSGQCTQCPEGYS